MYIREKWNISISNKKNLDDPPFHPLEIVLTACISYPNVFPHFMFSLQDRIIL